MWLRRFFGSAFYFKPQKYLVRYEASLEGFSLKNLSAFLILPLPRDITRERSECGRAKARLSRSGACRNTTFQKLESNLEWFPADGEVKEDEKYGNRYVVWTLGKEGYESKKFGMSFSISVSPVSLSLETHPSLKNFSLDDYDPIDPKTRELFGAANRYLLPDDPEIRDWAHKLRGTEKNVFHILERINDAVIQRLHYGNPFRGLYSCREALEKDKVDCGGFGTLFISLCLALGIPARVVSGFWAGYRENAMHAWVEVLFPDGTWMPVDPSVEKLSRERRTKKWARLGSIGSDRIVFSVGCDIPLLMNGYQISTDILQNPLIIEDNKILDRSIPITFSTKIL